jgi:hypothetical protein
MPLQATSGAASYDAFGGGVPAVPNYIEEVFSTYLWTGNGTSQTITNGIDLSTKGGLVWIKNRNATWGHILSNTVAGIPNSLNSNNANAQDTGNTYVSAFSTTGFSVSDAVPVNANTQGIVSWTFRKQPKFFDVVTYTGTGSNTTIAHSLGSVPACIMVKRTDTTGDWQCYHRSLANTEYLVLNTTAAKATGATRWNSTTPTSTVFSLGTDATVNASGGTYVAYLFAHDAGGFGLTGTDNVISCGSFTASSGGATITLGYEPAWVLMKQTNGADNWYITDSMREFLAPPLSATQKTLRANTSGAELDDGLSAIAVTSTGFNAVNVATTGQYIYIAIRRGPMKVPTDATKVFTPVQNSNFTDGVVISGQSRVDVSWSKGTSANQMRIFDRLRGSNVGANYTLYPDSTGAEGNEAYWALDQQNGVRITATLGTIPFVNYFLSRAPGFFDEVCYTGTGSARTVTHNLGVVPELMIIKVRSPTGYAWRVYAAPLGNTKSLRLNTDNAEEVDTYWNNTTPTSSVFSVNDYGQVNNSGSPIVAYLFATCAGVSKVGSYTGTGALQTVNCGFTSGVRFVLIKRTDSTGDWYTYDSARGITGSDDPYFLFNSSAAQVTNTNYVDTDTTGFKVTAAAPAALNASGGSYIFLAIA